MRRTSIALLCALGLAGFRAAGAPFPITDIGLLPGDTATGIAPNSQQDHAVAKGGDRYLVAWSDYRGQSVGGSAAQGGGDIFGVRIDPAGNPLDPVPFLIAGGMGLQRGPRIAWNGENWLVLYTSQDPVGGYYEDRMRAVRVSPQGAVLDATPLLFPPTEFTPNTIGLQLAGQNGQWLITRCIYHSDGYGTYLAGQRINAAGQLLDVAPLMLMDWVYGATTTLVANGEYLVVGPDWSNSAIIKARRINANAQPLAPAFTVPSMTIASNGSEYYVTWLADYVNLVGSRISSSGTLLTPAGTIIKAGFSQYNQAALAGDADTWWLVWGAADMLHTVRISAAGTVLDNDGGPLLPITIGGNINYAYNPLLTPRAGGGVNVLWYDLRVALGYDANVFMIPVDANNVAGAERCISTSTRNHRVPDLAEGPGGEAALVYISELANDDRVYFHRIGPRGQPLTTAPIEIAAAPSLGKAAIAWNGTLYLATWDDATGIKARRIAADGAFVDPEPLALMPGFAPDVEALGNDFLIASSRVATYPQTIFAQAIRIDGGSGAPLDAAPLLLGGGYVSTGPRVRSDGARWIVTYHSHWSHDSPQSDVIYNFVRPDGTFTAGLNPATSSGGAGTPDVAWSGNKLLFVWRSNSLSNANNYISGRVMNPDGSFATGVFTIAEAPGRQLRPVVGWDGASFVVAWDDQRNQQSFFDERTDIYGARVAENGVVLDPTGFAIQRSADGDATAAILSRATGVSLVASARFTTQAPFDSYRVGLSVLGDVPLRGDANCDGAVNNFDIDPFVLALVDPAGWQATFPNCNILRGDVNADGVFNNFDIDPFVACVLSSPAPGTPCP